MRLTGRCTLVRSLAHGTASAGPGRTAARPHFQPVALTITLVTDEPENRVRLLTHDVERRCSVMTLFPAANVGMDVRWITQPTGS